MGSEGSAKAAAPGPRRHTRAARQGLGAKIKALEAALETEQAKTDDLYRSLRRALMAGDEAHKQSADLQARLDGVNAQLRGLERENERMRGWSAKTSACAVTSTARPRPGCAGW
jgi:chromosome segregation ATPase